MLQTFISTKTNSNLGPTTKHGDLSISSSKREEAYGEFR